MSIAFKIFAIQIPKSFNADQVKSFFDTHTNLKSHEKPDDSGDFQIHFQQKRKKNYETHYAVPCNDNPEVKLLISEQHQKNKFKLNKFQQRGDTKKAGRPKSDVKCEKVHVEDQKDQPQNETA